MLRRSQRLSQAQIANSLNISQQRVSRIENRPIRIEDLIAYAKAIGSSPEEVFRLSRERRRSENNLNNDD